MSAHVAAMPELAGVEHRFVQAGDLRMHVAEAGARDRPAALLLHGWPEHWWMWRRVIPRLAERYHVIAPDLRGQGWTDAPPSGYRKEELAADVVRLLDALGIDDAYVAGHDWGGYVGFMLALLHPERVRRYLALNIIHPWVRPGPLRTLPATAARLAYQLPIMTPLVNARTVTSRRFVDHIITRGSVHGDAWSEADLEAYRAPLRDPRRIRASAQLYRSFALRELVPVLRGRYRAHRLRPPTLLLFGTRDRAMAPHLLDGFEPYADDMRVELVEDSAHFIVEEKPALVVERALEHFSAG
jgi:pimeloyl-ACP methyl ester carboxylesterase